MMSFIDEIPEAAMDIMSEYLGSLHPPSSQPIGEDARLGEFYTLAQLKPTTGKLNPANFSSIPDSCHKRLLLLHREFDEVCYPEEVVEGQEEYLNDDTIAGRVSALNDFVLLESICHYDLSDEALKKLFQDWVATYIGGIQYANWDWDSQSVLQTFQTLNSPEYKVSIGPQYHTPLLVDQWFHFLYQYAEFKKCFLILLDIAVLNRLSRKHPSPIDIQIRLKSLLKRSDRTSVPSSPDTKPCAAISLLEKPNQAQLRPLIEETETFMDKIHDEGHEYYAYAQLNTALQTIDSLNEAFHGRKQRARTLNCAMLLESICRLEPVDQALDNLLDYWTTLFPQYNEECASVTSIVGGVARQLEEDIKDQFNPEHGAIPELIKASWPNLEAELLNCMEELAELAASKVLSTKYSTKVDVMSALKSLLKSLPRVGQED